MAFPKGSGAAVIRRRRCRSAAPCGASHRVHGVPGLSVELVFLENLLSKRSPWGVRPLPPVPRPAAYLVGFSAQDGQDGVSCANIASKVVPSCLRWPPRGLYDAPRCLQDGQRSIQDGPSRPRWLVMLPNGLQDGSTWPKMAPKRHPRWPERPPRRPKRLPRRLRTGPRMQKTLKIILFFYDFHDPPSLCHSGSRRPLETPKRALRGPKMPPRLPKLAPERPQDTLKLGASSIFES